MLALRCCPCQPSALTLKAINSFSVLSICPNEYFRVSCKIEQCEEDWLWEICCSTVTTFLVTRFLLSWERGRMKFIMGWIWTRVISNPTEDSAVREFLAAPSVLIFFSKSPWDYFYFFPKNSKMKYLLICWKLENILVLMNERRFLFFGDCNSHIMDWCAVAL